jgi:uncharacterized membrane protein
MKSVMPFSTQGARRERGHAADLIEAEKQARNLTTKDTKDTKKRRKASMAIERNVKRSSALVIYINMVQ